MPSFGQIPDNERLADFKARLAAVRWAKESGGVDVNGVTFATDEISQGKITGTVYSLARGFVAPPVQFKAAGGVWVEISTVAEADAIGQAVSELVQKCFTAEFSVSTTADGMSTSQLRTADPQAMFDQIFNSLTVTTT